jgi:hypothetical protein
MAKFFEEINTDHRNFLAKQRVFFVATAPRQGRINLSPKGMDTFRVLKPREVAYLDLTGSGNETAAHLLDDGRITIMFCSFANEPLILRIYGRGHSITPRHAQWQDYQCHFPTHHGERQIIAVDVESLQTSCGFSIPLFEFKGERPTLEQWAAKKGEPGIAEYQRTRNRVSIDGLPTGLLSEE